MIISDFNRLLIESKLYSSTQTGPKFKSRSNTSTFSIQIMTCCKVFIAKAYLCRREHEHYFQNACRSHDCINIPQEWEFIYQHFMSGDCWKVFSIEITYLKTYKSQSRSVLVCGGWCHSPYVIKLLEVSWTWFLLMLLGLPTPILWQWQQKKYIF